MKQTNSNSKVELVKRMKVWAKPHYKTFAFCLFLLFISSILKIIGPVVIQVAIDQYILPKNTSGLILVMLGYIVLLVLGFVANYVLTIKLEVAGQNIIAKIKNQAFSHILTLNMAFFDQQKTGKLVSRVENDSNAMKVLFTSVITNVLGSLLMFAGIFIVLITQYGSSLALYVISLFPIIFVLAFSFDKFISPRLVKLREYVADVSGYVAEIVNGISIIQIFGQEKQVVKELEKKSWDKYKVERVNMIMFNSFFNIVFFMDVIGICIVLSVGGKLVIDGKMTIGTLVAFINFLKYFFWPIIMLSGQLNEFQKGIAGATKVFNILDLKNEIPNPDEPIHLQESEKSIEFKNVWFRYSEESEWILKDVSFKCNSGDSLAIVGPTGSGKSTIINLLLKFYTNQKGDIYIGGVNLKYIASDDVREKIGLVLQDNILFPGNIYENISMENITSSKEQVIKVMNKLNINSTIEKLPNKYETELKENALNLSTGEKQLISFARALYKDPNILILDEATSNIDPETEEKIKSAMLTLTEGRTSLIVAHRLSTIKNSTQILVLQNGKIIEKGNHHDLQSQGGFYADLTALQAA